MEEGRENEYFIGGEEETTKSIVEAKNKKQRGPLITEEIKGRRRNSCYKLKMEKRNPEGVFIIEEREPMTTKKNKTSC